MTKKWITVEEFTGRRLTGGTYYQWMTRMMEIIATIQSDNQQFQALKAQMTPLLQKLSLLIKQAGAFADTPAVKAADYWRDKLVTVIYMHIYFCSLLPAESSMAAAGAKLYPQVKPYKSLQKHEMTQETAEITGLLRVLTAEGNREAVQTLGLTEAVGELQTQNGIIQAEMTKREREDAARKELKDGETSASLRQQIEAVYEPLMQMVNAFVVMGDQSAPAAVSQLNAVIDHYQQIEAQKTGKASGNGNNSTPVPGGSDTPASGDTPAPSGGSDQGGGSDTPPTGGSSDQGGGGSDTPPSGGGSDTPPSGGDEGDMN